MESGEAIERGMLICFFCSCGEQLRDAASSLHHTLIFQARAWPRRCYKSEDERPVPSISAVPVLSHSSFVALSMPLARTRFIFRGGHQPTQTRPQGNFSRQVAIASSRGRFGPTNHMCDECLGNLLPSALRIPAPSGGSREST